MTIVYVVFLPSLQRKWNTSETVSVRKWHPTSMEVLGHHSKMSTLIKKFQEYLMDLFTCNAGSLILHEVLLNASDVLVGHELNKGYLEKRKKYSNVIVH